MTAHKKTTTKSKTSPAPATKTAAKTPATRKKAASAAPVQAAAPAPAPLAPVAQPVVTTVPAAAQAPVVPPPAALERPERAPQLTQIVARTDVGFGNALYIRGEGPGLSWDKGLLMDCVTNDSWQITLPASSQPYTFKFLINDSTWCTGPDFTTAAGSTVTVSPQF